MMSRDALVVGINSYNHLQSLNAPAKDAEAVAQRLEQDGNFMVRRLPAVKTKDNPKPQVGQKTPVTLKQLKAELAKLFIPGGTQIPDTALFYFSGHGLQTNLGFQEGFLATSDVNPEIEFYGLSLKWLRELLTKSPVKQQIIWLDCCHSGEFLVKEEANPKDEGKARDRFFIAASRQFEPAYEGLNTPYSAMTKVLLEGLDPTRYPDQRVTNDTLTTYIRNHFKGPPQRVIFHNSGDVIELIRRHATPVAKPKISTSDICPYKGLEFFKEEDHEDFYGRTQLTDKLLAKVSQTHFLAVLGASGSGKSSILRAGLLYQLKQGQRISGSDQWRFYILRPGEQPLDNLASVFVDPALSDIERATQLHQAKTLIQQGAKGLQSLVQATSASRVVLIIDQFEEVFNSPEKEQFFECILGAVDMFAPLAPQVWGEQDPQGSLDFPASGEQDPQSPPALGDLGGQTESLRDQLAPLASQIWEEQDPQGSLDFPASGEPDPQSPPGLGDLGGQTESLRDQLAPLAPQIWGEQDPQSSPFLKVPISQSPQDWGFGGRDLGGNIPQLCIIIAMRADFFGKCVEAEYSGLAKRIQDHQIIITPMNTQELETAITQPANRVGLEIEPELIQRMIADVHGSPGSLPLLQYTLTELWKQRQENRLQLTTYQQLGGVGGTLDQRATAVYNQLNPPQQQATVRHIFLSLTQLGEGTEDTRRRVMKSELITAKHSEAVVDAVIQKLAQEKLLVTSDSGITASSQPQGVEVVDVPHEALIRHWKLLRKWLSESRDYLRKKRQIEAAAADWRNHQQAKDYLLQGKRLQEAREFHRENAEQFPLSTETEKFIQASVRSRRNDRIKLSSFLIIPVMIVFAVVEPVIRAIRIREAHDTIETGFVREKPKAVKYLTKGCKQSSMFGNCESLREANLSNTNLSLLNLNHVKLNHADLSYADLSHASLDHAELSNADLNHTNFWGTFISHADLSHADLSHANLRKAIFTDATLNYASLNHADLSKTNLVGAFLWEADLSHANLSGALLSGAKLLGANLSNTNLSNADFTENFGFKAPPFYGGFD